MLYFACIYALKTGNQAVFMLHCMAKNPEAHAGEALQGNPFCSRGQNSTYTRGSYKDALLEGMYAGIIQVCNYVAIDI